MPSFSILDLIFTESTKMVDGAKKFLWFARDDFKLHTSQIVFHS